MNYTKPIIIGIGIIAAYAIMNPVQVDPEDLLNPTSQVSQPNLALTPEKVIVPAPAPLLPTSTRDNPLITQFTQITKNGQLFSDNKILQLYKTIQTRNWGVRYNIKEGDMEHFKIWGEDYIQWQARDLKEVEALVIKLGYSEADVDALLESTTRKGTMRSVHKNTLDSIGFLKSLELE